MKLYIIRHAKVDLKWPSKCNSQEFDEACGKYDQADIIDTNMEKPDLDCEHVYVSSLRRSRETARRLFSQKNLIEIDIGEVPLRSYKDHSSKKPLWIWNVMGRFQWYCNNHRQQETKKETMNRCNRIIEQLEEAGADCIMVTHGFFMRSLIKCLKKRGYQIAGNQLAFSNLQVVVARK